MLVDNLHYDTCTAQYPEKVAGEAPQALQHITLDAGLWVDVCVDCGATIKSNLDKENIVSSQVPDINAPQDLSDDPRPTDFNNMAEQRGTFQPMLQPGVY